MIMKQEKTKQACPYIILMIALLLAGALFLLIPPLQDKQRAAILVLVGVYVFWSIWYHFYRGDLDIKVILEYIIMAVLGAYLLLALVG